MIFHTLSVFPNRLRLAQMRNHFLASTALAGGLALAIVSPSVGDVVQDFQGARYSGARSRLETDAVHISLQRSASVELVGGLLALDGQLVSATGPYNLFLSLPNGGVEFQSGSRLASEGNVFMMARNGVLFQDGARIDVPSLVATSSAMSQNALQRALRGDGILFDEAALPDSVVENRGTITVAQGGFAALVAPTVRNSGSITARSGRIVLAGGTESFAIDPHGDGLIQFEVASRTVAGGTNAVEHSGFLQSRSVRITTGQMTSVLDRTLSISGKIIAHNVKIENNGDIVLGGAQIDVSGRSNSVSGGGNVTITAVSSDISINSSTLDASGASGGSVTIATTGHIALTASTVDASASQGDGGSVRIGGDYQGTGKLARSPTPLYVDAEYAASRHGCRPTWRWRQNHPVVGWVHRLSRRYLGARGEIIWRWRLRRSVGETLARLSWLRPTRAQRTARPAPCCLTRPISKS